MSTHNLKKSLAAGLAALTLGAAVISTSTPASAAYGRHGAFAAGLIGGLAVGALAAGAYAYPYPYGDPYGGPYYGECWVESRPVYNPLGYVVGYRRVRICN
jgi:hypothetical protein